MYKMRFLILLSALSIFSNSIWITNSKKTTSLSKDDDEDRKSFFVDRVAKYLPDNFLQDGLSLVKNLVNNNFDISKSFKCEFRCPDGSRCI